MPIFSYIVSSWQPCGWTLHPNDEPQNCNRDLLPRRRRSCIGGCLFCTKCYKCFIPEMDSALHFISPADERESYPVEYYFLSLSLLAVIHFVFFLKMIGKGIYGILQLDHLIVSLFWNWCISYSLADICLVCTYIKKNQCLNKKAYVLNPLTLQQHLVDSN